MPINIGTGFDGPVFAIKKSSTGKYYVGGAFSHYQGVHAHNLIRLNSDGSPDFTFNIGTGFNGAVHALEEDSSGKVYVGGTFTTFTGTTRNRAVRLTSTGAYDSAFNLGTGFGGGGGYPGDIGITTAVLCFKLVSGDSRIYMGGNFTTFNGGANNFHIIKINTSNGAKDTSFINAYDDAPINFGLNGRVRKIDITSGNKIMVGGYFTNLGDTIVSRIARLNLNGSLDTSWDTTILFPYTSVYRGVSDFVFDASGNTYVVGASLYMFKLSASNGANDTSFVNHFALNGNYSANTILLNSTGDIIVGGKWAAYSGQSNSGLITLNPNGTIDNSMVIGTGFNDSVRDMIFINSNEILVGGNFTSYSGVTNNRLVGLNVNGHSITDSTTTISDFGCINTSYHSISLGWEMNAYPNSFKLYRDNTLLASFTGTTTGYTDTNLPSNQSFTYKLCTIINGTTGMTATSICSTDEYLIWNFRSEFVTGLQFDLKWNLSGASSGLTLQRLNSIAQWVPLASLAGNVTSYNFMGAPAAGYDFRIFINEYGEESALYLTVGVPYYQCGCDPGVLVYVAGKCANCGGVTGYTSSVERNYPPNIHYNYEGPEEYLAGKTAGPSGPTSYVPGKIIGITGPTSYTGHSAGLYSVSGIKRVWFAQQPDRLTYIIEDATYKTLGDPNTVERVHAFNQFLDFKEFQVDKSVSSYSQELSNSKEGFVFTERLTLKIVHQTNTKWKALKDYLDSSLTIIFQDNNGRYYVMGYEEPAQLETFSDEFGERNGSNGYNLSFIVVNNYNMLKFVNPSVLPNIYNTTKFNDSVFAMEVSGDSLYVGGAYSSYYAESEDKIVKLNVADLTRSNDWSEEQGFSNQAFFNRVTVIKNYGSKIYVGGFFYEYDNTLHFNIVRLNSDGSVDNTFSTGVGFNDIVWDIAVDSTGLYCVGNFTSYKGVNANKIIRLTHTGDIDTAFDYGTGFNAGQPTGVKIDPATGKIYVYGVIDTYDTEVYVDYSKSGIKRINSDGSLDNTFSPPFNGLIPNPSVTDITIDGSGDVYIVGLFVITSPYTIENIVRVNSNGSVDTGFACTNLGPIPRDITADNDGKIMVAGNLEYYNTSNVISGLVRLNTNGTVDNTFTSLVRSETKPLTTVYALRVLPDDSMIIAGDFNYYNGILSNNIAKIDSSGGFIA